MIHRCECNQGFAGDGINCTGELYENRTNKWCKLYLSKRSLAINTIYFDFVNLTCICIFLLMMCLVL